MYPQLYLRTFWRMDLRPQIFVAMSFAPPFRGRFDHVIAPAIQSVVVDGVNLKPYRVDLSRSGDSILTDIMDGIAHSQMFLADVSTVGYDRTTGEPYRNANVLYEVGLALACRQPTEVLLIRDDTDKFLFDVSTIPHITLDFSKTEDSTAALRDVLEERLRERDYLNDARVKLAASSISFEEAEVLKQLADLEPGRVWGRPTPLEKGAVDFQAMSAIPRLLDKQLIKVGGEYAGQPAYVPTQLGRVVANVIKSGLPHLGPASPATAEADEPPQADA